MRSLATLARRREERLLPRIGLAALGLAAGLLAAEAALRLLAPLLPLPLAVFVREEARPAALSALRVARGARIVLREEDFRRPADVVVLGDSMVFGSLVGERDLFTTRLAAETGQRVLNLGVGSQGPCAYNHMLQVALSRLPAPPATVFYTVFANDFVEPECGPQRDADLFFWEEDARRDPGLRARWVREWALQHSVLYQLAKRWLAFRSVLGGARYEPWTQAVGSRPFLFAPAAYWRPLLDPGIPAVSDGLVRLLSKALAARASLGPATRFVLVLMPFKEQVYLPLLPGRPADAYPAFYDTSYDAVRDQATRRNLACLDLRVPFRRAARDGARLYFRLDGHLTAEGHYLVAGVLAHELRGLTTKGELAEPAPATGPLAEAPRALRKR